MPTLLLQRIALFLALCIVIPIGLTQSNPEFPALTGRVIDQAKLLSASTKAALTEQLAAHEAQTSNQVIVVTVNSLGGFADADYALKLGREWGIGTADKNNGVILLVAPNERKVRIEVGYGLEGALPDGLAGQIIRRNILPAFKESDYPGGIQSGVNAILQAVVGEYKAESGATRQRNNKQNNSFAFMPLFFMAMVAVPAILRRKGLRRFANAAFPSGFAGLAVTVLSGNFLVGIVAAVAVFAVMFFNNTGGRRNGRRGRGGRGMGGGFGGGFGGGRMGGGFGGGGGGFGGGGASGSW